MWMLKSPRMVPGTATAESVCPIMALKVQTTLGPSQTCSTEIKVGRSGDHQGLSSSELSPGPSTPSTTPARTYHGHHRAGAHVADKGWVEGLPPKVVVVLSKDILWCLGGIGRGERGPGEANPLGTGAVTLQITPTWAGAPATAVQDRYHLPILPPPANTRTLPRQG